MPAPKTSAQPQTLGRMAMLDGVRLVAAVSVMLFHFTVRNHPSWGMDPSDAFPVLSHVTQFGRFGVDLFFVISGFVILMSAWGRDVPSFATSRVTRLFPAYWAGVLLTGFLLEVLWPGRKDIKITDVVANLTMVQSGFGFTNVDGAYWTLWVELRFYLLIGVLLLVGLTGRRALAFASLWPVLAVIAMKTDAGIFSTLLIGQYAPLFAGGMAMYLVARDRKSLLAWLVLAQNVFLATTWTALDTHKAIIDATGEHPPVFASLAVSVGCFAIVALVTLTPLRRIQNRWLTTAGLLTYPLYILHEYWGWAVIQVLHDRLPKYVVLAIAIAVCGAMAWGVHKLVEQPLAPLLKRGLRSSFESLSAPEWSGRPAPARTAPTPPAEPVDEGITDKPAAEPAPELAPATS